MSLICAGIPVSSISPNDQGAGLDQARPACPFTRTARSASTRRTASAHRFHSRVSITSSRCPGHEETQAKLISFIWSPGNPLPAGTGGSGKYTVGQVRELTRRGVAAQVVTVGLGARDGRDGFPGIPFLSVPTLAEVGKLDTTVIFV